MCRRVAALGVVIATLAMAPVWAGEPPNPSKGSAATGQDDSDASQQSAMRDPLRPPGYGASGGSAQAEEDARFDASAWTLNSTLVARDRRTAIINGRNVREGGRVGGATVLTIESGRVVLDYRGRRFSIQNPTPSVRSRARYGDRRP